MTHQGFCYSNGMPSGRATEVFTLLQSGALRQECNSPFLLQYFCSPEEPIFALQGVRVTQQEFCYGDGTLGGRATEVFTSLQSGAPGQDCNGFFLLQ